MTADARIPRTWWLAVLAVALVARVAVIWKFGAQLDLDRDLYLGIARHLAAGDGFMHPDSGQLTAYRPPLYPLLLVMTLPAGRIGIAVLHLLVGVATVALTIACGLRLRLGKGSLLAGLLTALDPLLLQGQVQIMTETLASALAVGLLFVLIPDRQSEDESSSRSPPLARSAWQGLLLGFCCLCRPTFWAFAACAGLIAVTRMKQQVRQGEIARYQQGDSWRWFAPHDSLGLRWLMTILVFTATQLPWIIRNQVIFGVPILTTTHGGYTLLLGHNPTYYRDVAAQPWGTVWPENSLKTWQAELEGELSRQNPPLDFRPGQVHEVARDRWMSERAWQTIRSDPWLAIRSGLTLLGRFWSVAPQVTEAGLPRVARWSIGVWYALVFIAAGLGLLRIIRTADDPWWHLIVLIASVTIVHALYWADMRMRAPLSPALALLAVRSCWGRGQKL